MADVMSGVRILEVAEHTFVPAASALLAEWGAEVVKIEHVERGDAMRGLAASGTVSLGGGAHVLLEHSNRGKQSLGLDLSTEAGLDILYRLAEASDVFLTNKLPRVRRKLSIDLEHIRAHNPDIIYVCGSGQGERGPDRDKGSYDSLAYWSRSSVAAALTPADDDGVIGPPGPAFGDSIGAMTIAGGIMGALFHRERTGEATTVDVSLLGTGMWSMGATIAMSLQHQTPWRGRPKDTPVRNPLSHAYQTGDGRYIFLTCLQAGKYWAETCAVVGRPELATDERFADAAAIAENAAAGVELLTEAFAERPLAEWRQALADFSGQWAVVQDTLEVADDQQTVANGYVQPYESAAGEPFRLVSAPVQFGGQPAPPLRAPDFNEHGDEILQRILGLDYDQIIELKLQNVIP
ncbi:CaiB/BaiF CoA transferase family protein [Candidatus Poriferisocius sp.]|uniref:CaiB/BaiF CoA transferase family protein n=1 Tax=Candidatus Poriferisocius sp. TaxID=3101276 RepID=UPI003B590C7E